MLDLNIHDLNIFQKYCDNRINKDMFIEYLKEDIPNVSQSYADEKWANFSMNQVRFITSRNAENMLKRILKDIEKLNYDG